MLSAREQSPWLATESLLGVRAASPKGAPESKRASWKEFFSLLILGHAASASALHRRGSVSRDSSKLSRGLESRKQTGLLSLLPCLGLEVGLGREEESGMRHQTRLPFLPCPQSYRSVGLSLSGRA